MTNNISVTVNGKIHTATVESRDLLVHFLRENLSLTGTHIGCDTSSCGACTIHVDGKAVKSFHIHLPVLLAWYKILQLVLYA